MCKDNNIGQIRFRSSLHLSNKNEARQAAHYIICVNEHGNRIIILGPANMCIVHTFIRQNQEKIRMITLPVLHACVSCGTPIGSEKKRNWLSISSTGKMFRISDYSFRCPRHQVLPLRLRRKKQVYRR